MPQSRKWGTETHEASDLPGRTTEAPTCLAGQVAVWVWVWLRRIRMTRMGASAQTTQRQRMRGRETVVHVGRDLRCDGAEVEYDGVGRT